MALFAVIALVTILGLLSKANLFSPKLIKFETSIPQVIDEIVQVTTVDIPQQIENNLTQVQSKTTEIPITKESLIDPVIVSSSEILPEILPNKEITNQAVKTSESQGTNSLNQNSGSSTGANYVESTDYGNAIVKTSSLDKLPEFPGGIAKFYAFVGNNFEKPVIDDNESIRVIVNFIIEKDGSMTNIQVRNDPGYGIAKEAIRVLKSLKTKWIPGVVNSKSVRTGYSLPITIQLE
jgi:protein TonB